MRHYILGLAVLMTFTISQANTTEQIGFNQINTKWSAQTATPKERVHAKLKTSHVPRIKFFRSNPLRKSLILSGRDPDDLIDDDDIITSYNRQVQPKRKIYKPDDELPEHIRWRLFLARQMALLKYKQIHG